MNLTLLMLIYESLSDYIYRALILWYYRKRDPTAEAGYKSYSHSSILVLENGVIRLNINILMCICVFFCSKILCVWEGGEGEVYFAPECNMQGGLKFPIIFVTVTVTVT